jgi:thiamine biosynthesis lipoprotein
MGMTVKVGISGSVDERIFQKIFSYFEEVDRKFSTYKSDSEISKINNNLIKKESASGEMQEIFRLAEKTKTETNGYFDIVTPNKKLDPSGVVKGWAIKSAAQMLRLEGFKNFYIDAGGDIEVSGKYKVGIRNPFKPSEVVKVLNIKDKGIATSGSYVHASHIYNPKSTHFDNDIVSLTVIGPDVLEADRFATAAFAMGRDGIFFIENLPGFEAYMIDRNGIATLSSGFEKYYA